ncbi:hypothetical protein DSECCO2_378890 [anaerobic digester metagenome]
MSVQHKEDSIKALKNRKSVDDLSQDSILTNTAILELHEQQELTNKAILELFEQMENGEV